MKKEDRPLPPEPAGRCSVCGETIFEEDDRYEMPDGCMLCLLDGRACLDEWSGEYLVRGSVPCA